MTNNTGLTKLGDLLSKYEINKDKYVSREFQQYGYDLAQEMEDPKRVSFYIKLAKDTPRGLIESARSFVKDASNVRNRGSLFVWKLTQLKKIIKDKKEVK